MRWQLIVQTAVGFGALFWLGRHAVDRYVGPSADAQAKRTARAEAHAVTADIAIEWMNARDAQRALVETLAGAPVIGTLGRDLPEAERASRLSSALSSGVAQLGGRGVIAIVAEDGQTIASRGDGGAALSSGVAAKDALSGVTSVRLERLQGTDALFAVAASPLAGAGGGRYAGALVIAAPIDDERLKAWGATAGSSERVHVALHHAGRLAATTMPPNLRRDLDGFRNEAEAHIGEEAFVLAQRRVVDDGGIEAEITSLARMEDRMTSGIVGAGQTLVSLIGVVAFALVVLILLVAPSPSPELVEVPAESPPEDETARSGAAQEHDRVVASRGAQPTAPPALQARQSRPVDAVPEEEYGLESDGFHGAASAWAVREGGRSDGVMDSMGWTETRTDVPSHSALQGALESFETGPIALPEDALSVVEFGDPSVPSPSVIPIPPPPPFPEAADLFSAIDQAAFRAAPSRPAVDPAEDLPAPKGGMPLGVSPLMAAQTPSTDLPMPKGGLPPGLVVSASRGAPVNPHREVLPPLSATPPLPTRETADVVSSRGAQPPVTAAPPVPPQGLWAQSAQPTQPLPSPHASVHEMPDATTATNASPSRAVAPPIQDPLIEHGGTYRGAGVGEAVAFPGSTQPRANSTPSVSSESSARSPGSLSGDGRDTAIPLPGTLPTRGHQGSSTTDSAGAIPLPGSSAAFSASEASAPGGGSPSGRPHENPSRAHEVPAAFDENHYRHVYHEFVASKARLGEPVHDVTFEGFSSRLRSSEQELITRHGCRAVRFQVLVKDRTVSLRPQLVR